MPSAKGPDQSQGQWGKYERKGQRCPTRQRPPSPQEAGHGAQHNHPGQEEDLALRTHDFLPGKPDLLLKDSAQSYDDSFTIFRLTGQILTTQVEKSGHPGMLESVPGMPPVYFCPRWEEIPDSGPEDQGMVYLH